MSNKRQMIDKEDINMLILEKYDEELRLINQ